MSMTIVLDGGRVRTKFGTLIMCGTCEHWEPLPRYPTKQWGMGYCLRHVMDTEELARCRSWTGGRSTSAVVRPKREREFA